MNRAHRMVFLTLCVSASAVVAACGGGREPLACKVDSDCGAQSKCALGACIAGSTPQAVIVITATQADLVSHRDITFDGSQSTDPNPGGAVRSYAWAVKRGRSAGCDPTATTGSRPSFTTNFQCPGQYTVELKVTNDLHLESLPEAATLEIAPSTSPPAITAIGPALTVVHRCEGSPLLCRAFSAPDNATAFQLSVAATDVEDGTNLSYAWTYELPAGVDPSQVHVTFDPSPNTPTPLVHIASDGAIAGEWTFQARVTDSNRLTAVAPQKIFVRDTAPTVTIQGGDVVLGHSYLAPTDRYVATATVRATLSDDDGDPIPAAELTMAESLPSSCAFRILSSDVSAGAFTGQIELSCPGTDAGYLMGSVERALTVTATDVNGVKGTDARAMRVGDAAPVLTWSAAGTPGIDAVQHTVVPCPPNAEAALCFAVDAPIPYAVSDLENDPVTLQLSAAGLPATGAYFTPNVASGRMSLLVPVTKPTVFRGGDGRSPATFTLAAADPWTVANPVKATFGLAIGNRTPALALLSTAPTTGHSYSRVDNAYHARFNLAVASDPDLDPLAVAVSSSDGACTATGVGADGAVAVDCRMPLDPSGTPVLGRLTAFRAVSATATDPWGATATTPNVPLTVTNGSPSIGNQRATVMAQTTCVCNPATCSWQPQGAGTVEYDPIASDPDGDPLSVAWALSDGTGGSLMFACLPGSSCTANITASGGMRMRVYVSDGSLDVTRDYIVGAECTNDTSAACGPLPGRQCN